MLSLDAHARPPEAMAAFYKYYQKLPLKDLELDMNVVDFTRAKLGQQPVPFESVRSIDRSKLQQASTIGGKTDADTLDIVHVFEPDILPGLHIVPALIPDSVQLDLLSRLLHRDLAEPKHQTNLHKHYHIPYEATAEGFQSVNDISIRSFFHNQPTSAVKFQPIDSEVHKALPIARALNRKLRWITLGGQYDWTDKVYPEGQHPDFPRDIADMVQSGFPDMKPEAAIVNLYSPTDTLSLHRDVSEESDQGLVSISIGCEAIFIIGLAEEDDNHQSIAIRLRSGDAVYMSGPSRYAWHGVPRIIPDSCPEHLCAWPATDETHTDQQSNDTGTRTFETWRGWMNRKRINLNVRQMNP